MQELKVNETVIPLEEVKVKRGDQKGATYPAPDSSVVTWELIKNAWGEERLMDSIIIPKLRFMFKNWYSEATSEAGVVDWEQFSTMAGSMSARGESLKVIQERIMETIERLTSVKTAEEQAHLIAKLTKLREDAMNKRRSTKDEDEDEDEVPGKVVTV